MDGRFMPVAIAAVRKAETMRRQAWPGEGKWNTVAAATVADMGFG
jgi:hypothetical protein